jgi:hypothetical protein
LAGDEIREVLEDPLVKGRTGVNALDAERLEQVLRNRCQRVIGGGNGFGCGNCHGRLAPVRAHGALVIQ